MTVQPTTTVTTSVHELHRQQEQASAMLLGSVAGICTEHQLWALGEGEFHTFLYVVAGTSGPYQALSAGARSVQEVPAWDVPVWAPGSSASNVVTRLQAGALTYVVEQAMNEVRAESELPPL